MGFEEFVTLEAAPTAGGCARALLGMCTMEAGDWSARVDGLDCRLSWSRAELGESLPDAPRFHLKLDVIVPSLPAPPQINSVGSISGCVDSLRETSVFEQRGDSWYGLDGSRIPSLEIEALRRRLLDSRPAQIEAGDAASAQLADLGLTARAASSHREMLREYALRGFWRAADEALDPTAIEQCLSPVAQLWALHRRSADESTEHFKVIADFGGEPRLWVAMQSRFLGGLPLHVVHGSQEWLSFDPELARELYPVLPTRFSEQLVAGLDRLPEVLWTGSNWSEVRTQALNVLGFERLKLTPGFAEAELRFDLRALSTDPAMGVGLPLSAHLAPRSPGVFRAVLWQGGSESDANENWRTLIEHFDAASEAVQLNRWLVATLKVTPSPQPILLIDSNIPRSSAGESDRALVRSAWDEAGLDGEPEFRVLIACSAYARGPLAVAPPGVEVHLSSKSDALLITSSHCVPELSAPKRRRPWTLACDGIYAVVCGEGPPTLHHLGSPHR